MYLECKNLIVWQKAHQLTLDIYKYTSHFPKEEIYGLTSQMKRAAVSIPSNISEGRARDSSKEYLRFLSIARGSLEELRYQILLAKDLDYINQAVYNQLVSSTTEISKMLNKSIKTLKAK